MGMQGETLDDVRRTLALARELASRPASLFPIFLEPLPGRGAAARFGVDAMRPEHLELVRTCYEANFRWVPRLFTDNQRAVGTGWARRTVFRCLGVAQVWMWRRRFRQLARCLTAAAASGPTGTAQAAGGKPIAAGGAKT
jgi:hypothetical protein